MENPNRAEAERLLGIAEKLLHNRDLSGSRDFAILAQETEPLIDGSDQILAVADVLLASEKRINNQLDWYSILQVDSRSDDQDLIKKQYRRLALLLHPDKNKFPYADQAFNLVADSWAVLSDSSRKSSFDSELNLFSKVNLSAQQSKLPVRRGRPPGKNRNSVSDDSIEDPRLRLTTFWTACPYCYLLYEYPRVYEGCCLRCQNCKRAFQAVILPSLPPLVPGQEAYYCCWGFFPMGFVNESAERGKGGSGDGNDSVSSFPNWMPPIIGSVPEISRRNGDVATATVEERDAVDISHEVAAPDYGQPMKRKVGRPRKLPFAV